MNRGILLVSCLIIVMFIALGAVSAADINSTSSDMDCNYDNLANSNQEAVGDVVISEDIPTIDSGSVSGGVDMGACHPWTISDAENGNRGDLSYTIPSKATDIKCAYVYVSIYSGSAQPNYGSIADISIKTDNGYLNKTENLWIGSGTTDGVNYIVNDHITKCYSDYMIFYNITDLVQGLSGTQVKIDVSSLPMNGKSFDGRIKLISLILAYDDGDSDTIDYWINAGQAWTNEKTYTHFDSAGADVDSNTKITLTNIGLSSNDAFYEINGESLFEGEGDEYISGDYYQYHRWDVTDYFIGDTDVAFTSSKDGWGSFKEALSLLIIDHNFSEDGEFTNQTTVDFKTEYSIGTNPTICIFAGTNNTITVTASTSNKGYYTVELLVDGAVADKADITLLKNTPKTVYLTDPAVRNVDKNTVYGQDNGNVNYTVRISSDSGIINSTSHIIQVLYNGYLGRDLAYPKKDYESFNITVTGDIVIDIKDESSYLDRTDLERTDVWNVNLDEDSSFVNAYVYVPYNYFIPDYSNHIPEDINMFDVTFNGVKTLPVGFYRDQSNIGNYAKYGYGLLVYDVSALIKNGENTFVLNKKDTYPAVFPGTLIYLYNTTDSSGIKEIYISNGVDLLENSFNLANRPVKSDVHVDVNPELVEDATLYVFAAGAEENEGNIIFNGVSASDIWDGTLYTTSLYALDVTDSIDRINNVSFVSTASTIQALQQIIVLNKDIQTMVSSITTENEGIIFTGVENSIAISIDNSRRGKAAVELLADGKHVNSTEITLGGCGVTLTLTDPTVRQASKNSVCGEDNDKVNYTVNVIMGNEIIGSYSKTFSVLYNGYLGKDLAYPLEKYELYTTTVTGDIVVSTKDNYLSLPSLARSDVWNVSLPKGSDFTNAFIYVPYYFFDYSLGVDEGKDMFSAKFNGADVVPIGFYRDQSNYGVYAKNGYGLLVYDVSGLITQGANTFALNKNGPTATVCPSTLVYLYNTTGSSTYKNVYISNGADLLFADSLTTQRQVKSDSFVSVDLDDADDAVLYVFATGAQKGEGNIIFNGYEFDDVWNGKAFSSEVYALNVKDKIENNNTISFVSTGDMILALQQIIVTSYKKTDTIISAKNVNMIYSQGKDLTVNLKDIEGNALSYKAISISINGKIFNRTTDANGQASLTINLVPNTYKASLTFSGDEKYIKSSSTVKIVVKKATPKLQASKKTFKVKVKTKKYTVTLKDNRGKLMKKVKITLNVNKKTYKATTNSKGKATFKITKLNKKGKFLAKIKYSGNRYYNGITKKVYVTVKK